MDQTITEAESRCWGADDPAFAELVNAYMRGTLVLFVGAGISAAAGLPSWRKLVEKLCERALRVGASNRQQREAVHFLARGEYPRALSTLKCALSGDYHQCIEALLDDKGLDVPDVVKAIAELAPELQSMLTTNLDRLLERALPDWQAVMSVTGDLGQRSHTIFKLHGTLVDHKSWVFTREEYDEAMYAREKERDYYAAIFRHQTVLFVGYGLEDPDLDQVLGPIRALFKGQPPRNFALVDRDTVLEQKERELGEAGIRLIQYENASGRHLEVAELLRELAAKGARERAAAQRVATARAAAVGTDARRPYLSWIERTHSIIRGIGPTLPLDRSYVRTRAYSVPTLEYEAERRFREEAVLWSVEAAEAELEDGTLEQRQRAANPIWRSTDNAVRTSMPGHAKSSLATGEADDTLIAHLARGGSACILGDPGCGKTSFVRWLARRHAQAAIAGETSVRVRRQSLLAVDTLADEVDLGPTRVPIVVRVAEFAAAKERDPTLHLRRYLCRPVWQGYAPSDEKEHELDSEMVAALVGDALDGGKALVVCDGFDEVADRGGPTRGAIRTEIEVFLEAARKSGNQMLLTSRLTGYEPHQIRDIPHFLIQPLDPAAVSVFCHAYAQAFATAPSLSGQRTAEQLGASLGAAIEALRTRLEARRALTDASGIKGSDITNNLQTLSILCNLHCSNRDESFPQLRYELYDRIVETWLDDAVEKFDDPPLPRGETLAALGQLATSLHDETSQALMGRNDLHHKIRRILRGMRGETRPEPVEIDEARTFVRLLTERVGLFCERGKDVYGFTHLTLQEYFAARALAPAGHDEQALARRLVERIGQPRWREALLMSLGIASARSDLDFDVLVRALLQHDEATGFPHAALLVAEAVGELKFLPAVVADLITRALVASLARIARGLEAAPFRESVKERVSMLLREEPRAVRDALCDLLSSEDAVEVVLSAAGLIADLNRFSPPLVRALQRAARRDIDSEEWGWPIDRALRLAAAQTPFGWSCAFRNLLIEDGGALAYLRSRPEWVTVSVALFGGIAPAEPKAAPSFDPVFLHRTASISGLLADELRRRAEPSVLVERLRAEIDVGKTASAKAEIALAIVAAGSVADLGIVESADSRAVRRSFALVRHYLGSVLEGAPWVGYGNLEKNLSGFVTRAVVRATSWAIGKAGKHGGLGDLVERAAQNDDPLTLAQFWVDALTGPSEDRVYNAAVILDTLGAHLARTPELLLNTFGLVHLCSFGGGANWGRWPIDRLPIHARGRSGLFALALDAIAAIPTEMSFARLFVIERLASLDDEASRAYLPHLILLTCHASRNPADWNEVLRTAQLTHALSPEQKIDPLESALGWASAAEEEEEETGRVVASAWHHFFYLWLMSRYVAVPQGVIRTVAQRIKGDVSRAWALELCFELDPSAASFPEAEACAVQVLDAGARALLLARLARHATGADFERLLLAALQSASAEEPSSRASTLRALASVCHSSPDAANAWNELAATLDGSLAAFARDELQPLVRNVERATAGAEGQLTASLQRLAAALNDELRRGSSDAQAALWADLLRCPGASSLSEIVKYAQSEHLDFSPTAARVMDTLNTSRAAELLEPLLPLLGEPQPGVLATVRGWTKHGDGGLRQYAWLWISEVESYSTSALPVLLTKGDDLFRYRAARLLHGTETRVSRIGIEGVLHLVRERRACRRDEPNRKQSLGWAFEKMLFDSADVAALVAAAARKSDREDALVALSRIHLGTPRLLDALGTALQVPDAAVQRAVIKSLGHLLYHNRVSDDVWLSLQPFMDELSPGATDDLVYLRWPFAHVLLHVGKVGNEHKRIDYPALTARASSSARDLRGLRHLSAVSRKARLRQLGASTFVDDSRRAALKRSAAYLERHGESLPVLVGWLDYLLRGARGIKQPKLASRVQADLCAALLELLSEAADAMPLTIALLARAIEDLPHILVERVRTAPWFTERAAAMKLLGHLGICDLHTLEAYRSALGDVPSVQSAALAACRQAREVDDESIQSLMKCAEDESASFAFAALQILVAAASIPQLSRKQRRTITEWLPVFAADPNTRRDIWILEASLDPTWKRVGRLDQIAYEAAYVLSRSSYVAGPLALGNMRKEAVAAATQP